MPFQSHEQSRINRVNVTGMSVWPSATLQLDAYERYDWTVYYSTIGRIAARQSDDARTYHLPQVYRVATC